MSSEKTVTQFKSVNGRIWNLFSDFAHETPMDLHSPTYREYSFKIVLTEDERRNVGNHGYLMSSSGPRAQVKTWRTEKGARAFAASRGMKELTA